MFAYVVGGNLLQAAFAGEKLHSCEVFGHAPFFCIATLLYIFCVGEYWSVYLTWLLFAGVSLAYLMLTSMDLLLSVAKLVLPTNAAGTSVHDGGTRSGWGDGTSNDYSGMGGGGGSSGGIGTEDVLESWANHARTFEASCPKSLVLLVKLLYAGLTLLNLWSFVFLAGRGQSLHQVRLTSWGPYHQATIHVSVFFFLTNCLAIANVAMLSFVFVAVAVRLEARRCAHGPTSRMAESIFRPSVLHVGLSGALAGGWGGAASRQTDDFALALSADLQLVQCPECPHRP